MSDDSRSDSSDCESELKKNSENEDGKNEQISTYPKKQSRGKNSIFVKGTIPYQREKIAKWTGWGYVDSHFIFKNGGVRFKGDRYAICQTELPYFMAWIKENYGIILTDDLEPEHLDFPLEDEYPVSRISKEQLDALSVLGLKISVQGNDRFVRSQGQTLHDIDRMRRKVMDRIPDLVMWPECHEDVVEIVKICDRINVVIIPFGGGTSVTGAVECSAIENRPIMTLDTTAMNEILWVNERSLTACCEAGIIGQDLDRELKKLGYMMGHEPDSNEFSSLGGWVATRASGMKKNAYGNIEDIVVHTRLVTPRGVLEKGTKAPRISSGPDFNHVTMGSEGSFGVITEVVIKIRPLPECKRYGSLVFPDYERGVGCIREVAQQRCSPASFRLMDNVQFMFGKSLRGPATYFGSFVEALKMLYLSKIKGYNLNKIALATIVFEGTLEEVDVQERRINAIAAQYGGIPAGASNGERGYNMTYVIAYVRDVAYELNIMCESFETSLPWDKVLPVTEAVKTKIAMECIRMKVSRYMVMCRVAQVYETGACVYFYLSFSAINCNDPIKTCDNLVGIARDVIIKMGGSCSHHHGVGKTRRKWYEASVSPVGVELFKACKNQLDPNNIFATYNQTIDLKPTTSKL